MSNDLTKYEVMLLAEKAGFEHKNHIKYRGRYGKCTEPEKFEIDCFERFYTLGRADLETKVSALVPVVEQLVEALCELVQSDGLPRTLEQLDASVKKAFAAIAAGQTFIKESKHA